MLTDFEATLSAALEAMPTRQNRGATIGDRLGINSADTGLHSQRIRRRQFVDGQGEANAAALVKRLPRTGEAVHFVLDGTFTLANVIPVIQGHIGEPCRLAICTLGLNDATTDQLVAMLKAGTLTSLRLAMSSYFKASDPETAARAVTLLTQAGAVVAVERLHAKLQLCRSGDAGQRHRALQLAQQMAHPILSTKRIMKTETAPATITAEQLAELSNLSKRRLYQLAEEKKIPPADNGRFPMVESIRQLFLWFQRDGENLQKEKLRLATAARKKAERENEQAEAIQSRLWFPTDTMLQMFRAIVNRFEQLPGKVRSEAGANEVYERILQKHVDDVRRQIASDIADLKPKA